MNNLTDSNLGLIFAGLLAWFRLSLSGVDRKIGRAISGISDERDPGGESTGSESTRFSLPDPAGRPPSDQEPETGYNLCLYDVQSSTSGRFLNL